MKRKNILFVRLTEITIILTVSIMLAVSCHQQEPLIEKYEKSSVSELRNRGNEFLKKEQTDSALIYYTMAAGKYDRHLPDSLKMECASARCNAGWIHMFFKNDYISAYTSMLDAMEISEECNDSTLYPVIYLNIGNIYLNYAQYDYMLDNYRKAFRAAVGTQDRHTALITISTLMSYAIGSGNLDRIKNEMEIFDTLSIKDTNRELAAVRIQRDAAKALSKGDTATAMEKLKEAKRKCDPYSTYGRFGILCDNQIACLLTEQKKYQEAISLVKTICLDGDTPLEMKSQSSHMLANLYAEVCQADSSLKYNIMHQTLADSIFKSQQFGRIRDIRELRQLQKLDSKLILAESERKRSDMALRIAIGIGLLVLAFTTMLLLQNRKLRQRNLDLFRRNKEVREAENRERAIREEYERRLAEISSGVGNELNNTSESEKKRQADKKRKGPRLTRSLHDEILSRIIQILDNDTEISSTDFSLSRLSEMVNSNTHYVSEVINEAYGKNFNTLLGELRVNKACRLLDDNINYRHLTLEAIAMESGFKSRGNFAVVFKKVTGLTPSSYRKIAMEQAESSESSD